MSGSGRWTGIGTSPPTPGSFVPQDDGMLATTMLTATSYDACVKEEDDHEYSR